MSSEYSVANTESRLNSLLPPEKEPITFSAEEQSIIETRLAELSIVARFIGKDFAMPVHASEPGKGWHWDTVTNEVFADPVDILHKPELYSKFIVAHEGSHRRISRLPEETLARTQLPGYHLMLNTIEDPRVNNFLCEAYPKMREAMGVAYQLDAELEQKIADQTGLEDIPRCVQAGLEYMRQWEHESRGEPFELSPELNQDVARVVAQTLAAAQRTWWLYPSRSQAEEGEATIVKYSDATLQVMHEEVWPLFSELVEQDLQDIAAKMAQEKQAAEESTGESGDDSQGLEGGFGQGGDEVDFDFDMERAKQIFENLPEEVQQELLAQARELLGEITEQIAQTVGGNLVEKPKPDSHTATEDAQAELEAKGREDFRSQIEQLQADENIYEQTRRELAPLINQLEQDLRAIFVARATAGYSAGHKTGRKVHIATRMQEKAQGTSVFDSRAWQRRELPTQKDYAISLLVDLSGSMRQGQKIEETFKGVVVLAEALSRLSIEIEIIGFNADMKVYKPFGTRFGVAQQLQMADMLTEVSGENSGNTDDGWALSLASERLARRRESEQFVLVLSDGETFPSSAHRATQYQLTNVVEAISTTTNQKLIGLGIGSGTEHVDTYYPNSIANISVQQMASTLTDVIRQII